jgi:hypothetical protein
MCIVPCDASCNHTCGAPLVANTKVVSEVLALFLELNMAMLALFSHEAGSPAQQRMAQHQQQHALLVSSTLRNAAACRFKHIYSSPRMQASLKTLSSP